MNFIEELKWRGMLQDATPGIDEHLNEKTRLGYIGFDPTAPALTIGNFVQIMLLSLFQRSGHQPVVLMGGATGRIGDPSGRDEERQLKSYEELDANLDRQRRNFYKFLNFEDGPNKAMMVNNLDFYKDMDVLTFLRKVGKTLTINYMMSKESVQRRLDSGISFTEFSYQLLQAYDYQCLFQQHGVTVQMGGSDQWGNITSGTEFIRKNLDEKAYAVTTPLLTKADGSKFGKSVAGNIWLDAELTSPYQFYQFWINADDRDTPKFTRYFTLHNREEIEARETQYADDPQTLKRLLAEELTRRVHSEEAFQSVIRVTDLLFGRSASREALLAMSASELEMVSQEIPSMHVKGDLLRNGISISDLLTDATGILPSKGEARRAIQNNAISVNKDKITSHEQLITAEALLQGKYVMLENGKRNKYLVIVER
ncbi:MAG: tyrosine--tRNA ligase [Saprospiraceae bacterium]